jgi:hypothetical protein
MAFLYGTSSIGGLRLDLIFHGTDNTSKLDGKKWSNLTSLAGLNSGYGARFIADVNSPGASIAVRWGKDLTNTQTAHAAAGFRFADYVLYNNPNAPSGTMSKATLYANALWGINAGFTSDLNTVSTVAADLTIGGNFGSSFKPDVGPDIKQPGNFGIVLDAALANIFVPVAGLELGLKPYAGLGFFADPSDPGPNTNLFELALGVDAGLKARLPGKLNKFSVVTGAGLSIFDWYTESTTDRPSPGRDSSAWRIDGISFRGETLSSNNGLGLGLVLEPNQNLSIGFGINALIDGLFVFDLENMQIRPGSFFNGVAGGSTAGGFLTGLFDTTVDIDLTVSCKF